jgi:hypothetical protein
MVEIKVVNHVNNDKSRSIGLRIFHGIAPFRLFFVKGAAFTQMLREGMKI